MAKMKTVTDVMRMIDDGDMDAVQANRVLNILKAFKDQLAVSEASLRKYIVDHTDPNQTVESVFGVSTHRRGGEPKPHVKDGLQFGSWLYDNGEEDMTVHDVVIPDESITKPDALQALIKRHGGEIPDGVEYSSARDDSVMVKPAMSWDEMMADPGLAGQAMKAISISGTLPEITAAESPQVESVEPVRQSEEQSNEEERSAWDAI